MNRTAIVLSVLCTQLVGCPEPPPPPIDPIVPMDYASSFTEVRGCRPSGDHDLHNIRVLADPAALAPYRDRVEPFPVGALLVKEEYDFGDIDCTGSIVRWTAVRRREEGSAPLLLDWYWQEMDESFRVVGENDIVCAGCHMDCEPPDGYFGTCTVPP